MAKDIVMPKMGYDMTEGKLLRWIKHEGDTISKGEAVAAQTYQGSRIKASPLARRLAQEHELDLSAIRGTGPGGRVTRDDVLGAAAAARTAAPAAQAPQPVTVPAPEAAPTPALAAAG